MSYRILLSWFLSQAKNVGLAFVGREIVELVFVGRGNRQARFCRKRKLSKWVLSQAKNVRLAFVGRKIVELGFCHKRKLSHRFCYEVNRRTGLLSQEENVKLVLSKGKLSSRVGNLVLNYC